MPRYEIEKDIKMFGIGQSHVAIHNCVHIPDLQPLSTVSEDLLAVEKKIIRLHGQKFWLYGEVDPQTDQIFNTILYLTANK